MQRRGVTLVEAVLFLAISLGLIVGGLALFAQASLAGRVSEQVRVLSALVSEARAIYHLDSQFNSLPVVTERILFQTEAQRAEEVLIASGAIPASIVAPVPGPTGSRLRTEWGDELAVLIGATGGGTATMLVALQGIPAEACARLAAIDDQGMGLFSDRVDEVFFQGDLTDGTYFSARAPPLSPGEAGAPGHCTGSPDGLVNVWFMISLF